MPVKIRLVVGDLELRGELGDSAGAQALQELLPLAVPMSRWGDEYYGVVAGRLGAGEAEDAREVMEPGELAYWPVGNALCLFFGPTPASTGDEPRAASPVNPLGRLEGNLDALKPLPHNIEVRVERLEP
jgi:hypothetical protein